MTMFANHEAHGHIPTLVGMPSPFVKRGPVLVVDASAGTSRAPLWTVIGTRNGRLTRALGKPVSQAEALEIASRWSAPEQRAVFGDHVRAIPAAFDPCAVTAHS